MSLPPPFRIVYARLQASVPWMQSAPQIERALAHWTRGRCMGVFMGLFGLNNHELLVLLSVHDAKADGLAAELRACLPTEVEIIELLPLRATVRPATDEPFTRAGVHVFRFFTLPFSRMDEAVALSGAGWETFERDDDPNASDGYRTEPLGLFAQDGPGWPLSIAPPGPAPGVGSPGEALPGEALPGEGKLLLVTWYDSMTSWERSRTPNPQATINFRQRAALTSSIVAYATRLANTA